MVISHSGRWIFFACGRTGTTSIEQVLQIHDEGDDIRKRIAPILSSRLQRPLSPPDIKHVRPMLVREILGDDWNSYFKFVFVRNPWDWVVSQYLFNLRPGLLKCRGLIRLGDSDLDRLIRILTNRHPMGNPRNWQSEYVFDEDERQLVDKVCRFERLQQDFSELCPRLGIAEVELPLTNSVGRLAYPNYFNDVSQARVRREFNRDINLLGYHY
jgi:hypothetical protein